MGITTLGYFVLATKGALNTISIFELIAKNIKGLKKIETPEEAFKRSLNIAIESCFSSCLSDEGWELITAYGGVNLKVDEYLKKEVSLHEIDYDNIGMSDFVIGYIDLIVLRIERTNETTKFKIKKSLHNYFSRNLFTVWQELLNEKRTVYAEWIEYSQGEVLANKKVVHRLNNYEQKLSNKFTSILKVELFEGSKTSLKDIYVNNTFVPVKNENKGVGDLLDFVLDWLCDDEKFDFDELIIFGQPGQGKTSFCYQLMYEILGEKKWALGSSKIVYINLGSKASRRNYKKFFTDTRVFCEKCNDGDIKLKDVKDTLFIVDGVEELRLYAENESVEPIDIIQKLLETFSGDGNKMIFTVRLGYIEVDDVSLLGGEIELVKLLWLNATGQMQLASNYARIKKYERVNELKAFINAINITPVDGPAADFLKIPFLALVIIDAYINANNNEEVNNNFLSNLALEAAIKHKWKNENLYFLEKISNKNEVEKDFVNMLYDLSFLMHLLEDKLQIVQLNNDSDPEFDGYEKSLLYQLREQLDALKATGKAEHLRRSAFLLPSFYFEFNSDEIKFSHTPIKYFLLAKSICGRLERQLLGLMREDAETQNSFVKEWHILFSQSRLLDQEFLLIFIRIFTNAIKEDPILLKRRFGMFSNGLLMDLVESKAYSMREKVSSFYMFLVINQVLFNEDEEIKRALYYQKENSISSAKYEEYNARFVFLLKILLTVDPTLLDLKNGVHDFKDLREILNFSGFEFGNQDGGAGDEVSWKGIDFSYINMEQVSFFNANLEGSDFNHTNLSASTFRNCNLYGSDLRNTVLEDVTFENTRLTGSVFNGDTKLGVGLLAKIKASQKFEEKGRYMSDITFKWTAVNEEE